MVTKDWYKSKYSVTWIMVIIIFVLHLNEVNSTKRRKKVRICANAFADLLNEAIDLIFNQVFMQLVGSDCL